MNAKYMCIKGKNPRPLESITTKYSVILYVKE